MLVGVLLIVGSVLGTVGFGLVGLDSYFDSTCEDIDHCGGEGSTTSGVLLTLAFVSALVFAPAVIVTIIGLGVQRSETRRPPPPSPWSPPRGSRPSPPSS